MNGVKSHFTASPLDSSYRRSCESDTFLSPRGPQPHWNGLASPPPEFHSNSVSPYDLPAIYPPLPFYGKANPYDDQRHFFPWVQSEFVHPSDFPSNPKANLFPSCTISRASPSSSSASEDATPSPLQLNEYFNIFEFDFSTSNELPSSSPPSPHSSPLPSSLSKRRPLHHTMSPSPQHLGSLDLKSSLSREPSPSNGDNDQKRRFPCLILGCTRRFTSQYTLKVHMEAHKPKPRVSFPCTQGCSERFSRQHDRLRHEVAKHGKVCEFLCDDCGRFFSSKKTLGNHKCPVAQGGTRWVIN